MNTADWLCCLFLSSNRRVPKVSKGRPESLLAASAEAESLRCGSVVDEGRVTAGSSTEQTGIVYCSFSLRERTKEHPRGVTPLGHLPFIVLRNSMGVPGQLKTAPCLGLCLQLARMRCSCGRKCAFNLGISPLSFSGAG